MSDPEFTSRLQALQEENHRLKRAAQAHPQPLKTGGIMLGLLPKFPFAEASIVLLRGDLFLIYSDGVTEAKNVLEEDFGEVRLLTLVRQHSGKLLRRCSTRSRKKSKLLPGLHHSMTTLLCWRCGG